MPNFQISETRKRSDTPQPHKKIQCPTAFFFFLAKRHNKKNEKGDNHSHYLIIFLLTHPDAPDSLRAIHLVASKKNPKKEFPLLCPSAQYFVRVFSPFTKKYLNYFVSQRKGFSFLNFFQMRFRCFRISRLTGHYAHCEPQVEWVLQHKKRQDPYFLLELFVFKKKIQKRRSWTPPRKVRQKKGENI